MVLISLAILFAAIGALALTDSGDSDDAAEAPAAAATTSAVAPAAAPGSASAAPTTTAPRNSVTAETVEVRVLNNSNVSGLAAQTAQSLTSAGYTVAETGNYSDTQVATTTVYYGTAAAEKEAAEKIADVLGVSAQARPTALANAGTGVLVLVTE